MTNSMTTPSHTERTSSHTEPTSSHTEPAPSYDQLPIIDLSAADRGPQARALLHAQLHSAAHDVGFFQLVGHGVTQQETDALVTAMRAFFELPEADRLALDNVNSPISAATRAPATSAPPVPATGATSST